LLAIAFATAAPGVPPFAWPFTRTGGWQGSGAGFALLFADSFYLEAGLRSLWLATRTAALCVLLAYPVALGIRAARPRRRPLLLALVMLPFLAGFLPRLAAWIGLLRDAGWVNGQLLALGIIEAPVPLLYTEASLLLGMVHAYLPFAVLPLHAALLRLDPAPEQAAAALGASPSVVFRTVTLPQSLPGAAAAFLLVFIPAAGEFVIPDLLGPAAAQPLGRVLWGEFVQTRDWPQAAALAVALLVALLPPILLFQRLAGRG
jgi:putrescine transport system permease protein